MGALALSPHLEESSPTDGGVRKRVCKACDRCRLKKSKCDGASPCSRCRADNAICVFGERKKSHDKVYPKGYVEMLENQQGQLVTGLQELYKLVKNGQPWQGPPLKESNRGTPLTHDILEGVGALKHEGANSPEPFEEDLDIMRQKLIHNGAEFLLQETSPDGSPESEHSPPFEFSRPSYHNPFPTYQFPPPPPNQSNYPQSTSTVPSTKSLLSAPTRIRRDSNSVSWRPTPAPIFDDHMDFETEFDSATDGTFGDLPEFASPMFPDQFSTGMAINPSLIMKDSMWTRQNNLQGYLVPNSVA